MSTETSRLDNFTDAAFAFAVTLLVIGGGAVPESYEALRPALQKLPAFAMAFALIAMFWHGHVRWRRLCGGADFAAVALTMLLVFLVLVYVYPLRLIAAATMAWLVHDEARMEGIISGSSLGDLFTLYGFGFVAMSATVAALFALGGKRCLEAADRLNARLEVGTWLILMGTGFASIALAQFAATAQWAGAAYSVLPIVIPVWLRIGAREPLQPREADAT